MLLAKFGKPLFYAFASRCQLNEWTTIFTNHHWSDYYCVPFLNSIWQQKAWKIELACVRIVCLHSSVRRPYKPNRLTIAKLTVSHLKSFNFWDSNDSTKFCVKLNEHHNCSVFVTFALVLFEPHTTQHLKKIVFLLKFCWTNYSNEFDCTYLPYS